MKKIILSGGPSTGKSTTFEALKDIYPDAYYVNEAAEIVIQKEINKKDNDPSYTPIMPVTHYEEFAPLVIVQQLVSEQMIPEESELVFLDRSIIDNLGYLEHNGIREHIPDVKRRAKLAGYTLAFFCDWLGKFERTQIRQESETEGLTIHTHLANAYHSSGVPVVHLPAISVNERLTIIQNEIETL